MFRFSFLMWAELDSNQRRREPADLQSAPVDRFGIDPFFINPCLIIKKISTLVKLNQVKASIC